MKIFIFKLLIALLFIYIFFELAIGSRIDNLTSKIDMFSDQQNRVELKNKLKDEMKKGLEKESIFTEEERFLISSFIKKIQNELNLGSSQ